jgi:molecular chaperone GrpE
MVSHTKKQIVHASEQKKQDAGCATESAQPVSTTKLTQEHEIIAQLNHELAQTKEQLLRALADIENQRRRTAEELQNAHKYASSKLALDLLSVKDALEMALADQSGQFDLLKMGVELTLKQLIAAFEKAQISEISVTNGEQLDPHRHHAIGAEIAECEPNTILRVMQKGYLIADRVLRSAMVIVSIKSANQPEILENKANCHDLN